MTQSHFVSSAVSQFQLTHMLTAAAVHDGLAWLINSRIFIRAMPFKKRSCMIDTDLIPIARESGTFHFDRFLPVVIIFSMSVRASRDLRRVMQDRNERRELADERLESVRSILRAALVSRTSSAEATVGRGERATSD